MTDKIDVPTNPRQWRDLLANTVGSAWTFGSEAITRVSDGARLGITNAYYSAPLLQHQSEELAGRLAKFGISAIEAESQGGDKRRIVVVEDQLRQHGDKLAAHAHQQQVA